MLLLYAVGELPPADVAGLERRLADDASLRQRLDAVREDLAATNAAFEAIDDHSPLNADRAAWRASASLRSWQADRTANVAIPLRSTRQVHRPWIMPAAVAATVMLVIGGSIVMRNWPLTGNKQDLADRKGDYGLPLVVPDPEERAFHFAALKRLADGEEGMQDEENPAADTPASSLPPVAVTGPEVESGGVASAIASGEPIFDVPLTPDVDPSR
jgi:anti-sigma-K factor RskA